MRVLYSSKCNLLFYITYGFAVKLWCCGSFLLAVHRHVVPYFWCFIRKTKCVEKTSLYRAHFTCQCNMTLDKHLHINHFQSINEQIGDWRWWRVFLGRHWHNDLQHSRKNKISCYLFNVSANAGYVNISKCHINRAKPETTVWIFLTKHQDRTEPSEATHDLSWPWPGGFVPIVTKPEAHHCPTIKRIYV